MWLNKDFINNVCTHYEELKGEPLIFVKGLHIFRQHRKLLFYAVCKELLREDFDFERLDTEAPFGSIIGVDNSYLDIAFRHSKLFRLHAAFHDAFGYCKYDCDRGPGYSYIFKLPINSCLFGHVTGLSYWSFIALFDRKTFHRLDV